MNKNNIRITFDVFSLQQPLVSSVICKCVEATLEAEGISVPCEINVFVTNDKGIHAINKASRNMDKPTDVLSFPIGNKRICKDGPVLVKEEIIW